MDVEKCCICNRINNFGHGRTLIRISEKGKTPKIYAHKKCLTPKDLEFYRKRNKDKFKGSD